jgi:hypothetical protein
MADLALPNPRRKALNMGGNSEGAALQPAQAFPMTHKATQSSRALISLPTAKATLAGCLWLLLGLLPARQASGQGTVSFNNRIAGGVGVGLTLHVWGPSTTAPTLSLVGIGSNDNPAGATPFGSASGMALVGAGGSGGKYGYATTFAQLIGAAGSSVSEASLVPLGSATTFRTGAALGCVASFTDTLTGGPGIPAEAPAATFEIVAWDNSSGSYPNWAVASAAWKLGLIAAGHSAPFVTTAIGGGTNSAPNLNNDQGSTNGMTSFNLFFTNVCPGITQGPANQTVAPGQRATFSVSATGVTGYQWQFNGTNLAGATSSSFVIPSAQYSDQGAYSVVVTNTLYQCGTVSSDATLTVVVPVTILVQPENQVIFAGDSATFSVLADGTPPLSYQWWFNSLPISGATESAYTATKAQPANIGSYVATVANAATSTSSVPAFLMVLAPPSIVTQPQDTNVFPGQPTSFTVAASGTAPLRYQWLLNDAPIAGATASTYSLPSAAATNAGLYSALVTNAIGRVTSASARLTVYAAPGITSQPQSTNVAQGGNAAFSVAAAGVPAVFGYQWLLNGAPIAGATADICLVSNAQPADVGAYAVIVTNLAGSIISSNALLTVIMPPFIVTQPSNQVVLAAQSASFSVEATGTALAYQWRFNDADLPTATTNACLITSADPTNEGTYTVVVTNVLGALTSEVATLTVYVPPNIITQPQSIEVIAGQAAAFSVVASGRPPPEYQWLFNGAPIVGATGGTLQISNAQPGDLGTYAVMVTNLVGSVTSSNALLTFSVSPSIVTQPTNQTVLAGQSASFSVEAAGPGLTYQWRFNEVDLPGAITNAYVIASADLTNEGAYTVVVTNVLGAATSEVATLTVYVPPHIITQPQSADVIPGQLVTFSALASGKPPPEYQWLLNGAPIEGATASAYQLTNAQVPNNGSYSVVATNLAGSDASTNAILLVHAPLQIVSQPEAQAAYKGATVFFYAAAQGLPQALQWFKDGAALPGQTNNWLELPSVQTNDAGSYWMTASNLAGAVPTDQASLSVSNVDVTFVSVFGNGQIISDTQASFAGAVSMALQSIFPAGSIYYSLDGSPPDLLSAPYQGPFTLTNRVTLRAITYNSTFTQLGEAAPIDVTITAPLPTYVLSATTPGGGTLTFSPPSGPYVSNTTITVTATANPGWTFLYWLGDASGTNVSAAIPMTRNKAVQAIFGTTLSRTVTGSGSVAVSPASSLCPYGTVARLTATPQPGNYFAAWGNAASGNLNPLSFTMTNASPVISCLFLPRGENQVSLVLNASGFGQAIASPRANVFPVGTSVTLTATPDPGQQFLGWSGDTNGLTSPLSITLNDDKFITANFTTRPTLLVNSPLDGTTPDGFRFSLVGEFGAQYRLDATTNLVDWDQFTSCTNTYGLIQFTDPAGTNQVVGTNGTGRFYRALELP